VNNSIKQLNEKIQFIKDNDDDYKFYYYDYVFYGDDDGFTDTDSYNSEFIDSEDLDSEDLDSEDIF